MTDNVLYRVRPTPGATPSVETVSLLLVTLLELAPSESHLLVSRGDTKSLNAKSCSQVVLSGVHPNGAMHAEVNCSRGCAQALLHHDIPWQAIPTTCTPSRIALVSSQGPGCVSLWDTHMGEDDIEVTAHTANVATFAESMGIHKVHYCGPRVFPSTRVGRTITHRCFMQVRFDATGHHMIALDSAGGLSLWSTSLWIKLAEWSDVGAIDMEIVPDPSYQGHVTVALATKLDEGVEITIRQIPSFTEVCRFPAPSGAVLGCARDLQGRVLLLEPNPSATEYHLQCLRPSVPTHRLQELLSAFRFVEAEALGDLYPRLSPNTIEHVQN